MLSSLFVLVLAVIAPSVHATVFVTEPTAATSWPAGQVATITWQDDGNSPNLTAFGPCLIGLYVGSQTQQTLLQTIATNVNVANVSSQTWTPDATVGPNGSNYFIRFTSNSLPNPTQANAFAEAFSAKFALSGMTGTFNSSIQSEINGATTGGSSTPASGLSTGLPTSSSSKPLTTTSVQSSSSPSSSGKASSNGAGRMVVPSVIGASGIAAIAFALFI
ncbi:hypothetical protein EI94DRAFT_1676170 [Lactarius quietus]|nr:hypothetical protein EI94DRAFT_1676170 [Lactarius quietus]